MSARRRLIHANEFALLDRPRPKRHQWPDVSPLTASGRCATIVETIRREQWRRLQRRELNGFERHHHWRSRGRTHEQFAQGVDNVDHQDRDRGRACRHRERLSTLPQVDTGKKLVVHFEDTKSRARCKVRAAHQARHLQRAEARQARKAAQHHRTLVIACPIAAIIEGRASNVVSIQQRA